MGVFLGTQDTLSSDRPLRHPVPTDLPGAWPGALTACTKSYGMLFFPSAPLLKYLPFPPPKGTPREITHLGCYSQFF